MQEYAGFNLLVGEMSGEVWWLSNRAAQPEKVTPGIHGLSNHLLDTPWPKVRGGCAQLKHLLTTPTEIATPQFFSLLEDPQTYPDAELYAVIGQFMSTGAPGFNEVALAWLRHVAVPGDPDAPHDEAGLGVDLVSNISRFMGFIIEHDVRFTVRGEIFKTTEKRIINELMDHN